MVIENATASGQKQSLVNPIMVLLVDDQPMVGEAVRRLLSDDLHIEVHYCSDPEGAIDQANHIKPTVILQDLVMPKIDGLTMVRSFRANPETAQTPIIVLSTREDPQSKAQAFLAGANDYLVKLPDKVEFIARVVYHSQGCLNRMQRDEAYRALRQSQQQLFDTNTDLVASNQKLEEVIRACSAASKEADRANRAKSDFLSSMSHELRTPLNAILGFGQLLELDELNTEQKESVQQILRGGPHLLDLITQVLDVAKIESGRLELVIEPVDFGALLRDTVSLIRPVASQRQIEIVEPCASEISARVRADPQRLKQVLLNLLSNAIKYNRERGTVTISCGQSGDRFRISITDTGAGLTPENLALLFTPFERLGAENSAIEGTGLGLSLCKRLVESMHGKIEVESVPGTGSTFSFEVPLAESTSAPIEGDPAPENPKTILYIEDNLSYAELIGETLERRPGVKLLAAGDGALGLDLARIHRPDLILLDLQLPDINGEEVLHELRGDARTSAVPVIVISGEASSGDVERLRLAGASDYLDKPLNMPKFFATLDRVLELSPAA